MIETANLGVQVVKTNTSLSKEDIIERIADTMDRMSNPDAAIADDATIEYAGLQIARQYVENITESKKEEKALRDSIKQAKAEKNIIYRFQVRYVDCTRGGKCVPTNVHTEVQNYRQISTQTGLLTCIPLYNSLCSCQIFTLPNN